MIEQSFSEETIIEKCGFEEDVIGFAFYGSGDVQLEIGHGNKTHNVTNTTGTVISFFGNKNVAFSHKISHNKPLQCISIFSKITSLHKLPVQEGNIFSEHLHELIYPQENFVPGPHFHMTPDMQNAVHKILNTKYTGPTRIMFLKSQITELLSHFFGLLTQTKRNSITSGEKEKLFMAKEILLKNIEMPPSLNELSLLIGLNSNKLKKNFKALFGVPVFKYLQNERLNKAYELIQLSEMSIQQVAWAVGYESVSSFSNAFTQKFGIRPSEIKK